MPARRGRAQANGSDRINAHAASRFLRVFPCPPPVPRCGVPAPRAAPVRGYHPARDSPPHRRRGTRRPRRRRHGPAHVRRGVPDRAAARDGADGDDRRGERDRRRRVARRTSGSPAGSTPTTSSRTTTTVRSCSAASGSRRASGRAWRPFEDHRQSVPFTINEGLDSIGVDVDALDAGLDRRAARVGRPGGGPAGSRARRASMPDTPVRARIDQVSSVEHAIVVGYPGRDRGRIGDARRDRADRRDGAAPERPPDRRSRPAADPDGPRAAGGDADPGRRRRRSDAGGGGAARRGRDPDRRRGGLGRRDAPCCRRSSPSFPAPPGWSAGARGDRRAERRRGRRSPQQRPGAGLVGTPGLAIVGRRPDRDPGDLVTTIYVRLTAPPQAGGSRTRRRR